MLGISIKRVFFGLASVAVLTVSSGGFARADETNPRIALVIGNAAYPDQALATTANDAGLIAQTLQAAGFDVVGARDLDQKSLQTALRDFLDKAAAAGPDMQAFIYFAGRAQQYNGDNYFLPVDARIARDGDLPLAAIRISDIAHALAGIPGRARILVIDGARSNPYVASNPSIAPGLALEAPEPGELIAFDASPGALAGDEEGPYGVYGKTLAGALRQGGVDIAAVFDQTRVLVNQQTQGAVIPWSQSALGAPYYVFERAADAPPAPAPVIAAAPVAGGDADVAYYSALQRDTIHGYTDFLRVYPKSDQARRVRAILAARREASLWERTVATNSPRAYWTYVRLYPKGPHIGDARRRIAMLAAAYDPPPDFRPMVYDDLPPPPRDEIEHFDRPDYAPDYAFDDLGPPPPPPPQVYYQGYDDDWRDLPPPPPPREVGLLPVLGIAIPAIVGAIAYQNRGRDDGVAPAGAAPPRVRPPAPPALPPNVHPVAAAAPTPTPTPAAGGAPRAGRPGFTAPRPLPPIAQSANPPAGKPRPAGPQPTPTGTATPPAEKPKPGPLPTPTATATPPALKPTPAPLPTPTVTPPAEKPKPTPLPTPTATATPPAVKPTPTATATPPALKPTPAPLPTPTATPPALKPTPAPLPTPTATAAPSAEKPKPLPTPTATPTLPAVKPTPAPLPTPTATATPSAEKPKPAPLPTPTETPTLPAVKPKPAPLPTPTQAPTPPAVKPTPAALPTPLAAPTPHVEKPKPAAPPPPAETPTPHVDKPKPAAPPPPPAAAPTPHVEKPKPAAPPPPPPAAAPTPHVEKPKPAAPPPPPPAAAPPPPAVHAAPPPPPPPAVHAAPPPPPAAPPPPAVHAAPPPAAAPPPVKAPPPKAECGKTGEPACAK